MTTVDPPRRSWIPWEDPRLFPHEAEEMRREWVAMQQSIGQVSERERRDRDQRRQVEAAREVRFLPTSVATLIFGTIERCLRFGQNGLLIGSVGIGKTVALEEAVRRSDNLEGPNVALVTVTAVIGGSTMAIYEELCPHLGVTMATTIADTQRRLRRSACFFPFIIFDEAQNLTLKSARELLEIAKDARIAMLFCGNPEVLKLVNSAQAAIQQISRRLPVREEITSISDDDADLIASDFGVEGLDAFELARAIGRVFHADGIAEVLRTARQEAGAGRAVRLPHIREAIEFFPHVAAGLAEAEAAAAKRAIAGARTRAILATPGLRPISHRLGAPSLPPAE